jgi:hypothetical protein
LIDISQSNASIFSVSTASNAKIVLFDELSQFISDPSQRDDFCRAIINQLVNFSFEEIFTQKFDFFATIFEYLQNNVATASMVTADTGIPQKCITRYKRDLEKAGKLWEVEKKPCRKTRFKAWYLTTNPDKAAKHFLKQTNLF